MRCRGGGGYRGGLELSAIDSPAPVDSLGPGRLVGPRSTRGPRSPRGPRSTREYRSACARWSPLGVVVFAGGGRLTRGGLAGGGRLTRRGLTASGRLAGGRRLPGTRRGRSPRTAVGEQFSRPLRRDRLGLGTAPRARIGLTVCGVRA